MKTMKTIHDLSNKEITLFYGKNIYTDIVHTPVPKLKHIVDRIYTFVHGGDNLEILGIIVNVCLKDGTSKSFPCKQNEDGSFPDNATEIALKEADEYLSTLLTTTSLPS